MTNEKRTPRQPSFIVALIPIVVMIALMLYCFLGGSESGYHDAHMPLVLSIIVACIVGVSCGHSFKEMLATVYKGNIIKNLIMDCQSYTKYRPNETTGGIFVSWRRKEELPTGA